MNGNPEFVPQSSGRTDVVSYSVIKKVSWGAIFVGAFVSLAVLATLALLGLAIGLGSFSPDRYMNPFIGFSAGTGIWWLIIAIIAFFVGGMITSRLLAAPYQTQGVLHGIASWAVASLTLVILGGTAAGMILGGGLGVIGNTVRFGGAGGMAMNGMWGEPMWNTMYHGTATMSNPDMGMGGSGMGSTANTGQTGMNNSNTGMNNTNTPQNQAGSNPSSTRTTAQPDTGMTNTNGGSGMGMGMGMGTSNPYGNYANAQMRQIATQASHTASAAAGWAFVMLILSVGASVVGASIASPKSALRSD